jgi:hypothetical protein
MLANLIRRQFVSTVPGVLGGLSLLSACTQEPGIEAEAAAAQIRSARPSAAIDRMALQRELVRFATLAPSSHNTQCWKFAIEDQTITIRPDLTRRCPAVDPDDHHVFVSLGCAVENLVQAASAHGVVAEPRFDAAHDRVRVSLTPTSAATSPLFAAIAVRQCTRGDYDAKPLTGDELRLLERAGSSNDVRVVLITDRSAMERVLDHVVQANTAQMADPAFVKELKTWIRFNSADAVRTGDGLYSVASGHPSIPTWLGELAFGWIYTPNGENDKIVRQVRSSAGIAVFVGQAADKAHWVDVGRCYERFALQATVLGVRNAFLNQPVEVASLRTQFADALGLTGVRPDLVVRFGRGPTLPPSLRRTLDAVLVRQGDA